MVRDQDVIVGLAAVPVRMRHHEALRIRMHLLRQQVAQVIHLLHLLGVLRIKLLIAEGLPVVQSLDLAVMRLSQRTSPL